MVQGQRGGVGGIGGPTPVIPGLVPGTNTTPSAAIGPRHKAGDDEIVCLGLGLIVHPIAL